MFLSFVGVPWKDRPVRQLFLDLLGLTPMSVAAISAARWPVELMGAR